MQHVDCVVCHLLSELDPLHAINFLFMQAMHVDNTMDHILLHFMCWADCLSMEDYYLVLSTKLLNETNVVY